MRNFSFPLATTGGILVLFASACPAQPPAFSPPGATQPAFISRPTISPYLNLTRRGGSTASNYYNLVRPQNQFYQSIQQIQQEVGANTQDLSALQQPATGLRPTGFVAGFVTQRSYFMTMGQGTAARPPQPMMSLGGGQPGFGTVGGVGGTGSPGGQMGQPGGARPPTRRR